MVAIGERQINVWWCLNCATYDVCPFKSSFRKSGELQFVVNIVKYRLALCETAQWTISSHTRWVVPWVWRLSISDNFSSQETHSLLSKVIYHLVSTHHRHGCHLGTVKCVKRWKPQQVWTCGRLQLCERRVSQVCELANIQEQLYMVSVMGFGEC